MALDFKPVYSSWVAEIAHDSDSNEMHVRYRDGGTTIYSGVDFATFDSIRRSPSVGAMLHNTIRPNYPHRTFK